MSIHKPVLLGEVIENLNLKKGDTVVDATLGGGGHSLEILKKIMPGGKLIAIDCDPAAIVAFKRRSDNLAFQAEKENIILIKDNFSNLGNILDILKIKKVDAILADLGISSDQLESARGFSFQHDAPLDMRMDEATALTAREVVNNYSQIQLVKILRSYGEERYALKIARLIVQRRKIKPIINTAELVETIKAAIPARYQRGRIHPATRTFQAIRMEVNREKENIEEFLPQAVKALKKGGRLAIISFHSGEDALVKKIYGENARGCICPPETQLQQLQKDYISAIERGDYKLADKLEVPLRTGKPEFPICRCNHKPEIKIINLKPIAPANREILVNPRSRSAKLRVAERI
jgi:16S rRNA (cytosine1402-N4)-methyltransferase